MMMAAYAVVRPLVQAGKLKVLAFTASLLRGRGARRADRGGKRAFPA